MVHFQAKSIRFGYKNWVLCSDNGYPFNVAPYQRKALGEGNSAPGLKVVVTSLLEIVDAPKFHVYFDNFFTSPNLLLQTSEKVFKSYGYC